jgi:hypothetical protein
LTDLLQQIVGQAKAFAQQALVDGMAAQAREAGFVVDPARDGGIVVVGQFEPDQGILIAVEGAGGAGGNEGGLRGREIVVIVFGILEGMAGVLEGVLGVVLAAATKSQVPVAAGQEEVRHGVVRPQQEALL